MIEDYEKDSKYCGIYDFMNEDNFYIKYFCDRLEGNMKDYQKHYYGLKYSSRNKYKRCECCGKMIEIKNKKDFSTKYCDGCKRKMTLEKYSRYNKKRRLPPS